MGILILSQGHNIQHLAEKYKICEQLDVGLGQFYTIFVAHYTWLSVVTNLMREEKYKYLSYPKA